MSKQPRNVVMQAAHRAGMPVAAFARQLAARYPTMDAAAASIGTDGKCLARYVTGVARMRSRLVALADARGMDTQPFVVQMYMEHGTVKATAEALRVPIEQIRAHLKRDGVQLRKPIPPYTKARMIQMLRDGFRAVDIARRLGVPQGTAYYYSAKMKRMRKTVRRLDAA